MNSSPSINSVDNSNSPQMASRQYIGAGGGDSLSRASTFSTDNQDQ